MRANGGKVNNFLLSTSTSSRTIKKVRTEMLDTVKRNIEALVKDKLVSFHRDEKLIQQGKHFTAFEHIAVLSSYHNGIKLLGTTSPEKETGKSQAEAIRSILHDWKLDKQCVFMCFDTTASNTGKFNSASIHLEAMLYHPLAMDACRHNMNEVILSQVFKGMLGKSSGPQIIFFLRF